MQVERSDDLQRTPSSSRTGEIEEIEKDSNPQSNLKGEVEAPASSLRSPSMPLVWAWRDWLVLLLLLLLVLVFHWRLLTPNLADRQAYLPGDFVNQFWAFATFELQTFKVGELPLWNPYTYAGAPFWADVQSAVFYPFSLLTVLIATWADQPLSLFALEVEAVGHFWLAGAFMFLFARQVIQHRPAAFITALTFTFSGYLTGYPSQQLAVLEVDVWLPLILFFVDRAVLCRQLQGEVVLRRTPKMLDISLAGVAWGMAILAGHPQSWLLVGYTVVAYFVFLVWLLMRRQRYIYPSQGAYFLKWLGQLRYLIFILLIGLALSAIQLLPAIEYMRLSVRAAGHYAAMSGGFPLPDPIQILLPGVVSHYSPLYIGVTSLLLVVVAVAYGKNSFVIFWSIWAGSAFLITFGGETFFYSTLYLFAPGFSIFRGQERWAFIVAFSLCMLTGYGLQALTTKWSNDIQVQGMIHHGLAWFFGSTIGLILIFFYGLNETGWTSENQFYLLLNKAVFLTLVSVLIILVFRLACYLPIYHPVVLMSLSIIIIFDLFSTTWHLNLSPQLPEEHTQKPAIIAALKQDKGDSDDLFRVYNEFRIRDNAGNSVDNYGIPHQLQDLWGASPLRLMSYDRFLQPPMLVERIWAMLNVKYVITWRNELFVPSTVLYQEPASDGVTYLHRLNTVAPRAWLVHQIEELPVTEMLNRLATPAFDYRQTVLLPAEFDLLSLSPIGETQTTDNQIEIITFSPNRLVLNVETANDGILVLSEIYYPGWRATIDDQPVSIWPANFVLRALPITAGKHQVVMQFVPWSFWAGAILSAITVLSLLIFWVRRGNTCFAV